MLVHLVHVHRLDIVNDTVTTRNYGRLVLLHLGEPIMAVAWKPRTQKLLRFLEFDMFDIIICLIRPWAENVFG